MVSAYGRSIDDFRPLSPPEQRLADAAKRGEPLELDAVVPKDSRPDNTIRSAFVRFLVLGGDGETPVHEAGISLKGATLTGDLSFAACSGCRPLELSHCSIGGAIALDGATMQTVSLAGSQVAGGISGDGAQIKGDLFLADGFRSASPVRMVGAKIDGDFEGSNGVFCGSREALLLDNSVIGANLNLVGANCTGAVRLNGIDVKGDADFTRIVISGRPIHDLDLSGAAIALAMHRAAIGGRLYLLHLSQVQGQIRLIYAHCVALADDDEMPAGLHLLLDGFTYDRLYQSSPTSAEMRIRWLERGANVPTLGSQFRPQPASQLVKVLTEMGFEEDAKKVAIQREVWRRQRGNWRRHIRFFHKLYGVLTGYGYRPDWIIGYLIVDLAIASIVYAVVKSQNGIIPVEGKKNPVSFNAVLYSLDNGLPFINFGLSKEWRPNLVDSMESTVQKPLPGCILGIPAGWVARITIVLQTIFGWIGGIALLAFLNGLARRDK
jgi:hypothetical protein